MKRIFIPAFALAVAAVSIHCEADDPTALNENASLIGADTITDTIGVYDSVYYDSIAVIGDTVSIGISDTINFPGDSVVVGEPGSTEPYPGGENPGGTPTDSVNFPSDSTAVGWRIKGRK